MISGVVKMNVFKSFLVHSTKPLELLSLCGPLDLPETVIGAEVREESRSSLRRKHRLEALFRVVKNIHTPTFHWKS